MLTVIQPLTGYFASNIRRWCSIGKRQCLLIVLLDTHKVHILCRPLRTCPIRPLRVLDGDVDHDSSKGSDWYVGKGLSESVSKFMSHITWQPLVFY